jgi:autotransporter-associated beta strand protein
MNWCKGDRGIGIAPLLHSRSNNPANLRPKSTPPHGKRIFLVVSLALIDCAYGQTVTFQNLYVDRAPPVVSPPDFSAPSPFTAPPGALNTTTTYVGYTSGDDPSQNPGGDFELGGGSSFTTDSLYIGFSPGSTGLLNVQKVTSGLGSMMAVQDTAYVGYQGAGKISQADNADGPVTINHLILGAAGGSGAYELNGGELHTSNVSLGQMSSSAATGTFTQVGGVHSIDQTLKLGKDTATEGIYNLQAGNLNVGTGLYVGLTGEGIFKQTGGTALVGSAGGSGTMQIGGLVGNGAGGTPSQNQYDQTGGILTVSGDASVGCLSCGASSNSTDLWNLAGKGAVVLGTTTMGAGGTISISNGASFATGSLDNTAGAQPGVSVVDPALARSGLVIGDANSSTFSGTIMDGASTGGLTKSGPGTVSLSGQNTYTGLTRIRDGVLHLLPGGSIAGNVELGMTAAHFSVAQGQYLVHPSNAALQASEMTVAGWVYLDSKTLVNEVIAAKDDNLSVPGSEYWLGYETTPSNRFIFQVIGAVHYRTQSDNYGAPQLHTWTFVIGWYDTSAGQVYVSVNNGPPNSAPVTPPLNATNTPFSIGADVAPAGSSGSYLDGRVASIGLWKRVLSPAERTYLYNSGVPLLHAQLPGPMRTGLLSWWDLTETSGDRADAEGPNTVTDNNGVSSVLGGVNAVDLVNDGTIGGAVTVGEQGTLSGGGTITSNLTVNSGGTVDFSQTAGTIKGGIVNNGLFIVSRGAQFSGSGPSFVNNGTLDLISAGGFDWPTGFVNNGEILNASVVRPETVETTAAGVTITIDSYTGHTYQLQASSSVGNAFLGIGVIQQGATGTTLSFTDPNPNPDAEFYRVAVDP